MLILNSLTSKVREIYIACRRLLYILWLSITSKSFYRDVYLSYQGWGIKYTFGLVVFSTLIYGGLFFVSFSYYIKGLPYILEQIPEFTYQDNALTLEQPSEEPIYIKNRNGKEVLVFDLAHKLTLEEQKTIPIVVTAKSININNNVAYLLGQQNIVFTNLEKEKSAVYTKQDLQNYVSNFFQVFKWVYFLVLIPLYIVWYFSISILGSLLVGLIIYIFIRFYLSGSTWQHALRVAFFSSGIGHCISYIPLNFLWYDVFVFLAPIVSILKFWVLVLVVLGLRMVKKEQKRQLW